MFSMNLERHIKIFFEIKKIENFKKYCMINAFSLKFKRYSALFIYTGILCSFTNLLMHVNV